MPDVVAYGREKNLLSLIEAVHSTGPMSEIRVMKLKRSHAARRGQGRQVRLLAPVAFLCQHFGLRLGKARNPVHGSPCRDAPWRVSTIPKPDVDHRGRRPVFHIGLFCNFAGLNLYGYEKCFV